jgi:hypothetical protein
VSSRFFLRDIGLPSHDLASAFRRFGADEIGYRAHQRRVDQEPFATDRVRVQHLVHAVLDPIGVGALAPHDDGERVRIGGLQGEHAPAQIGGYADLDEQPGLYAVNPGHCRQPVSFGVMAIAGNSAERRASSLGTA